MQKNTYIQPKKLDYDDSFGADILSICTASIFIHIDVFPFCSDYKNNLYFFNKTIKYEISVKQKCFLDYL